MAGAGAAAAVLGLVAVLVAGALRDPTDTGPVAAGPTAPVATAPPKVTPPPVTLPAPPEDPRGQALEELRDLLDGRLPGAIAPDAAEDLRDRLRDVVEELAERNGSPRDAHVRDRLDDLLEEIEELEEDGELPPGWAHRLRAAVREAMAQFAG